MEPIQAVLAIVAFVRAGKYLEALPMALRLLASLIEGLAPADALHFQSAGFATAEAKSCESLCDDLEAATQTEGFAAGPLAPVLVPILIALVEALVRKWLGS